MPFPRSHLVVCALLAACGGDGAQVRQFGGPTMGSSYEVKFVADMPVAEVRAAVEAELEAFDLTFSNWRDDSEIARCNRHTGPAPFLASGRFLAVLEQALQVAAVTEGAFDPTVKPLSDLFRAARQDPLHRFDEAAVAAAKARVGYRHLEVQNGAVHKLRPDVELDLDGLVAGACVDAIAQRLDAIGVAAFYVEVTGEVFCRNEKAPGVPWLVGVVDPSSDSTGGNVPWCSVALRDRALCTSGVYRNAFVGSGRVRHHVFDPRTGECTNNGVVSVTVLARSTALADALGTAFLVLSEQATARLLATLPEHDELAVLFLTAADDGSLRATEFAWPR